jgi:hypothetical protein
MVVPGARHGPNVCPFGSSGWLWPDGMTHYLLKLAGRKIA